MITNNRFRNLFYNMFLLSCAVMIGLCGFFITAHAESSRDRIQQAECYKSVRVQSADSLQSISSCYYTTDYPSMSYYMERVMELNHMTSEELCAGTYLVVPYVEPEAVSASPGNAIDSTI